MKLYSYICIALMLFCAYSNGQTIRRQIFKDQSCSSLVGVYISNEATDCTVVEQCTAFPNGTHFYTQTCPENVTLDFPTEFNVAIISPNSTCKDVSTILASVPDLCMNINFDGNSIVTSAKLTACQSGSFGFGLYNQDCSALNNNLQFVGPSCTKATSADLTEEYLTGSCATIVPQSGPVPSNTQTPTTPIPSSNAVRIHFASSVLLALFLAPFVLHLFTA